MKRGQQKERHTKANTAYFSTKHKTTVFRGEKNTGLTRRGNTSPRRRSTTHRATTEIAASRKATEAAETREHLPKSSRRAARTPRRHRRFSSGDAQSHTASFQRLSRSTLTANAPAEAAEPPRQNVDTKSRLDVWEARAEVTATAGCIAGSLWVRRSLC